MPVDNLFNAFKWHYAIDALQCVEL